MTQNLPPHLISLLSPHLTPHLSPHLTSQLTHPHQVTAHTVQKNKEVSDDEDEKKEGEDAQEKKGDEPKMEGVDENGDAESIAKPIWTRNADDFI